jgi:type II secretory pathway component PulJ
MRHGERGAALLEAMVALAILAGAGASAVSLVSASLRAEREMADRERTLLAADRLLAAATLLTRTDLDRRLGRRDAGEFVVEVQRPRPSLYRIAVSESRAPEFELLVTVVFRRRPEGE